MMTLYAGRLQKLELHMTSSLSCTHQLRERHKRAYEAVLFSASCYGGRDHMGHTRVMRAKLAKWGTFWTWWR